MTPADSIYRVLLRLYPARHRHAFGQAMLQHARDQERAARLRGRRQLAALYLRLIGDGLVNAGIEQVDAIRTAETIYKPFPWLAILLAVFPGLWLALTRGNAGPPGPALTLLGAAYLVLLLVVPPIMWWRTRRFPVWALPPAGMLAWLLILLLGINLSEQANHLGIRDTQGVFIVLFNSALAAFLFITLLRGRRPPAIVWIFVALLLLGGILLAVHLGPTFRWRGLGLRYYLTAALTGPAEALALVAIGLLAARRYNVLALLVIVGGYAVMFGDNDYLWISPTRDWPGIPFYLAGMVFIFVILAPALFLRAKTRPGRAAALFIPVVISFSARIIAPSLILDQAFTMHRGDIMISVNILLSLLIGWFLYSTMGEESNEAQSQIRHPKPEIV